MRQLVMLAMPFTWYQRGQAINQSDVFHSPQRVFYVNPGVRQIRLRVPGNGIADVYLVFTSESIAMMGDVKRREI